MVFTTNHERELVAGGGGLCLDHFPPWEQLTSGPLDAAACCSLFVLTCAPLMMTSSQTKAWSSQHLVSASRRLCWCVAVCATTTNHQCVAACTQCRIPLLKAKLESLIKMDLFSFLFFLFAGPSTLMSTWFCTKRQTVTGFEQRLPLSS